MKKTNLILLLSLFLLTSCSSGTQVFTAKMLGVTYNTEEKTFKLNATTFAYLGVRRNDNKDFYFSTSSYIKSVNKKPDAMLKIEYVEGFVGKGLMSDDEEAVVITPTFVVDEETEVTYAIYNFGGYTNFYLAYSALEEATIPNLTFYN